MDWKLLVLNLTKRLRLSGFQYSTKIYSKLDESRTWEKKSAHSCYLLRLCLLLLLDTSL